MKTTKNILTYLAFIGIFLCLSYDGPPKNIIKTLLDMSAPILPACMTFGPIFLLTGILMRTPSKVDETIPNKKSIACLYAGTLMITYTLFAFFMKLYS